MQQVARNLTDPWDGFLRSNRYLIHDRATLFTDPFRRMLRDANVETIRLPAHSPNLNAYAQRFVRTIRQECLDRMIFFGEASLRRAIDEFIRHYHEERNHQGLANKIIRPEFPVFPVDGDVTGRNQTGHERAELSGHPNLRKSYARSEHFVFMINSINELRVDHENKMFTYAKSGGTLILPTT